MKDNDADDPAVAILLEYQIGLNPHFSQNFYCDGGSGHVYYVALVHLSADCQSIIEHLKLISRILICTGQSGCHARLCVN